jgi:hypothetical protein
VILFRHKPKGFELRMKAEPIYDGALPAWGEDWVWAARVYYDGECVRGGVFKALTKERARRDALDWMWRNRDRILSGSETVEAV